MPPKPVRLYHRTSPGAADIIERTGFRDRSSHGLTSGVWLSNIPLGCNEGAKEGVLFEVALTATPAELFYKHEVIETGKPYREFLVPAHILNDPTRCAFRRLAGDEKHHAEDGAAWNEYPPGEPQRTFDELDRDDGDTDDL